MTADEQSIRNLVADWMAATKSGDIDRVLDLLTEDVVFLTPGNPPLNKADFSKASKSLQSSGMVIDSKSDIKEVQVSGDWAFMWAHLSVVISRPQGERIERTGHTLTVFNRQNGKWRLARDANLLAAAKK